MNKRDRQSARNGSSSSSDSPEAKHVKMTTMEEVLKALHGIQDEMKAVRGDLNGGLAGVRGELNQVRQDLKKQSDTMADMKKSMMMNDERVWKRFSEVDLQLEKMQIEASKKNIIVKHVPDKANESEQELQDAVKEFYINGLNLTNQQINSLMIDAMFRMGRYDPTRNSHRPIKIKFLRETDRNSIYKNVNQLQGKEYKVMPDFPKSAQDKQSKLLKYRRQCILSLPGPVCRWQFRG